MNMVGQTGDIQESLWQSRLGRTGTTHLQRYPWVSPGYPWFMCTVVGKHIISKPIAWDVRWSCFTEIVTLTLVAWTEFPFYLGGRCRRWSWLCLHGFGCHPFSVAVSIYSNKYTVYFSINSCFLVASMPNLVQLQSPFRQFQICSPHNFDIFVPS